MINIPTVLVLGAGASVPYGYPAGRTLFNNIVTPLRNETTSPHRELREQGFSTVDIKKFADRLFRSGKSSVDAFLEYNPEFHEIGKMAIAQALVRFENTDTPFQEDVNEQEKWYKHLFERMNTEFENFHNNKLAIITFNYDRSLEQFLYTCLENSFDKSVKECAQKVSAFKIIHLHGVLGYLPFQADDFEPTAPNVRPYGETRNQERIKSSADMIKIIHEDFSKDPVFDLAYKLLWRAERVFFLGFGYHETNMNRLRMKELIEDRGSHVFCCSFGLPKTTIDRIKVSCHGINFPGSSHYNTLQFFRECKDLE